MNPSVESTSNQDRHKYLSLKIIGANLASTLVMVLVVLGLGPISLVGVVIAFPSLKSSSLAVAGTICIAASVLIALVPGILLHRFLMKRINERAA
jgi:pilus assembly protein TadC